jgi:hypothetical protein
MTASITHCWKSGQLEQRLRCCLGWLVLLFAGLAHAQSADITQFRAERAEEEIQVSAQIQFELPAAVEDALLKGIPMYFVAEADVLRERWYWYDKRLASVERHMRLAYQPLTRRWRLNVSTGPGSVNSQGLVLNQGFDTLPQALAGIKRVSGWKIVDVADLDPSLKYKVEFRFRLDLSRLPRPFQIGAIGQSDWDVSAGISTPLSSDLTK